MADDNKDELERLRLIAKAKSLTFRKQRGSDTPAPALPKFIAAGQDASSVGTLEKEDLGYEEPVAPTPKEERGTENLFSMTKGIQLPGMPAKLNIDFDRVKQNAPGSFRNVLRGFRDSFDFNTLAMGAGAVMALPQEIARRILQPFVDEDDPSQQMYSIAQIYSKTMIDGFYDRARNAKATIEEDPFGAALDVATVAQPASRFMLGKNLLTENMRVMASLSSTPLKRPWNAATGYGRNFFSKTGETANRLIESSTAAATGLDDINQRTIRLIAKYRKVTPEDIARTGGNLQDAFRFGAIDREEFLAARRAQRSARSLYEDVRRILNTRQEQVYERYRQVFPTLSADPVSLAIKLDDAKLGVLDDLKEFNISPKGRNIVVKGRRVGEMESGLGKLQGGGTVPVSDASQQVTKVERTPVRNETPQSHVEVERVPQPTERTAQTTRIETERVLRDPKDPKKGYITKTKTVKDNAGENHNTYESKTKTVQDAPEVTYSNKSKVTTEPYVYESSEILPGLRQVVEESKALKSPKTVYIDPQTNLPLTQEQAIAKNYNIDNLKVQNRPPKAISLRMDHLLGLGDDSKVLWGQIEPGTRESFAHATKMILEQEKATVAELDALKQGLDSFIESSTLANPRSKSVVYAQKLRGRIYDMLTENVEGYADLMGEYESMRQLRKDAAALMSMDAKNTQTAINSIFDGVKGGPRFELRQNLIKALELMDDGSNTWQENARLRARIAGIKSQDLFGKGLVGRNLGAAVFAAGPAGLITGLATGNISTAMMVAALGGVAGFAVSSPRIVSSALSALGIAQDMKNQIVSIVRKIHEAAIDKRIPDMVLESMTYADLIRRLRMSDLEREVAESEDRKNEAIETQMLQLGVPFAPSESTAKAKLSSSKTGQ